MFVKVFTSKKGSRCVALAGYGYTGRTYLLAFDLATICDISGYSPLELSQMDIGEYPVVPVK